MIDAVFEEFEKYPIFTEIVMFRIKLTNTLTFKYSLKNG